MKIRKETKRRFFRKARNTFAVLMAMLVLGTSHASACSMFHFNVLGNTFIGRTMEAPMEMDEQLVIVPQNYELHGIKVNYGFVGMKHGNTEWISSGLNEHGLNIEVLALGESVYAPKGEGDINHLEVVTYILGNAKSVDDAVELLKKIKVEMTPITVSHDMEIGMHYALNDGKRAIVVEYINGEGTPEIYENKLRVMTNDPAYPAQEQMGMAMLGGDLETGKTQFSEEFFRGFEKSPHGRFQQLVALNYTEDFTRVKTDFDAVNHAWAVVNSIEIVQGSLYWRFVDENPQMVGYSVVVDINNKAYHFRTYDNMDIRKVDLNDINFAEVEYQTQDIYRTADTYKNVVLN